MNVLQEFEKLLPNHECQLTLSHQPHKTCYETVEEYFRDNIDYNNLPEGTPDLEYCTENDRTACVATDQIWELHWYPNTPIGFHHFAAPTLERLFERLKP